MIVSALAPVVTTWLLGVLAGWRGDQDAQAARSLNTMVLTYALRLLLFIGTAISSREALAAEPPLAGALFAGSVGRRERRRRARLIASIRRPGVSAAPGEGLRTL
jgi:predicted permease